MPAQEDRKNLWVRRLTRTGKSEWFGVIDQEDAGRVLETPERYPEVYRGTMEQVYRLAALRDCGTLDESTEARGKILSQMAKIR